MSKIKSIKELIPGDVCTGYYDWRLECIKIYPMFIILSNQNLSKQNCIVYYYSTLKVVQAFTYKLDETLKYEVL